MLSSLPVAVIGAGPVGLAAAAHCLERGLNPIVFESGSTVGAGVRRWEHVRLFSPWRFVVDKAAERFLRAAGWAPPAPDEYPTGGELIARYLAPLAQTVVGRHVRLNTHVAAVTREGHDLMKDGRRDAADFVVRVDGPTGEEDVHVQAVIDASGTIETPGFLGAAGLPALGERAAAARLYYGIPDVLGSMRARYAGRRVLVVGSGHSAFNVLIDLAQLHEEEPATQITWALRRASLGTLLGGSRPDQLEERGRLGTRIKKLLDAGALKLCTGFLTERVLATSNGLVVVSGPKQIGPVDEIVAATGFRPDWSILSELRLDLDPAVQSPRALAPLIDPNVHSCGTVRPHGAEELKQPEPNLFVIGMKSYGRAPTFLLLTGYEQARSVVSAIAGDWESARRVELVLPETGVCSTDRESTGVSACCSTTPEPVAAGFTPPAGSRLLPTVGAAKAGCC